MAKSTHVACIWLALMLTTDLIEKSSARALPTSGVRVVEVRPGDATLLELPRGAIRPSNDA